MFVRATEGLWGARLFLGYGFLGPVCGVWLGLTIGLEAVAAEPSYLAPSRPAAVASGEQAGSAGFAASGEADELLRLSAESLESLTAKDVVVPAMEAKVTTVQRSESTVGQSPAAVYVITGEMIRRSGVRSLPDALRLAPGVNVARANSNRWAISIRGFNNVYANKLLVQIDGRTVYSPLFSGVRWDHQDVLLEDIERIEVIRGPGAAVWGANAVNGIINIITRKARDTQGVFLEGGGGTEERGFGGFRYGGALGEALHYRVYGLLFERDRGLAPENPGDNWRKRQLGFRMDWEPTEERRLTFQGDFYQGHSGQRFDGAVPTPPFFQQGVHKDEEPSGSNLLLRWSRQLSDESDWSVQLYYDLVGRSGPDVGFSHSYATFDLDFQHRFPLAPCHSLTWGFGYRNTRDRIDGIFLVSVDPAVRSYGLISYFVQDQVTLRPRRLFLTLGSKFEHNDFSGFEFQPTARLLWTPSPRATLWASVSRAVRTPSRFDQDFRLVSAPVDMSFAPPRVTFMRFDGSRAVESEQLLAYEIGARAQSSDAFWWDLAVFFNRFEELVASVPATPAPPPPAFPPAFWPMVSTNAMHGETYGFELAATWQVHPQWKLHGGYSFLKMHLHARPEALASAEANEGKSPGNQAYLQSSWDLGDHWQLDLIGRYVDNLPALAVPSYLVMDVRLAWLPSESLEMAVVGRHLLDSAHPEFATPAFHPSEVEAEVYGVIGWRH